MIEIGQFYRVYTSSRIVREKELNGTTYYVVRLGRRLRVIVQCPKCGRFRRLVIRRRGFLGTTFYVKHNKNDYEDYCTISAAEQLSFGRDLSEGGNEGYLQGGRF